ncbi:MAG: heme exporter protein CcmD [Endozoicomonas sp.]
MYFEDLTSFITMGGHGPYVWSAYGIGLVVLTWNVLAPLRARKRIVAQVQRQARQQRPQPANRQSLAMAGHSQRIKTKQQDLPAMETEEGTQ